MGWLLLLVLLVPFFLIFLLPIEPGAYDPQEYVDEWHRKRGR